MRLAMSDELATDDDPTAEGYEVDTFAARGPDGPESDDEDDDVESKKTSHGRAAPNADVVFEIGDEEDEADQSRDSAAAAGAGARRTGERQGLMSGSANGSEETLVPGKKRADKND